MLIWFVVLYLLVSIGIGLYAATRVHSAKDFAIAGRHLPLPVVTATVFATWFGAEAIFGVSATFVKEGLHGVVADPFGASLCLIIAGIFFSRKLYKLNVLTLGDYFRLRYNRTVEILTTLCIVIAYLGWVSAQIKALGLLFNVVTDGAISQTAGMILGAAIVLTYTTLGGMLSVAILDFVQMGVIMGGMLYIGYVVSGLTGGVELVINHASAAGKLDFFPPPDPWLWLTFLGAWITMMLGSIPQQDVYARVMSAKTEKIASHATIAGAIFYLGFCMLPIFLTYAASIIDPAMVKHFLEEDAQMILPHLIMERTPVFAQVLFFGALLSAIMSTASGTLLAPSVTFTENVLKRCRPNMTDVEFLKAMRWTIVACAAITCAFALYSDASIYEMVGGAYKVTLVAASVPLIAGLFWSRATTQGALLAIAFGLLSWLSLEYNYQETDFWPPQLVGLLLSALGMIVGSLLPQVIGVRPQSAALGADAQRA